MNQRVTIIPSDNMVIVGDKFCKFDFSTNSNYHAVQWDGSKGFIETKEGANITITSMDEFSEILAEHGRIVEENRKAEEAIAAYKETAEYKNIQAKEMRCRAFYMEADPLFFKVQRGEILEQEWLDKVNEIKARYPYI